MSVADEVPEETSQMRVPMTVHCDEKQGNLLGSQQIVKVEDGVPLGPSEVMMANANDVAARVIILAANANADADDVAVRVNALTLNADANDVAVRANELTANANADGVPTRVSVLTVDAQADDVAARMIAQVANASS